MRNYQSMLDEQFVLSNAALDPMPVLEAIIATQQANGIFNQYLMEVVKVKQ